MNRRYRKTIIAGNWKMNKNPAEAKAFFDELRPLISKTKWCEVVCCVPFVDIAAALKASKDCRFSIGAQNVHQEPKGAFTGEISADMLKSSGVKYVVVGHSERRQYFGENDIIVASKAEAVINAGMRPIICVGETLKEREMGITLDLISTQVNAALSVVQPEKLRSVVFAYEPVWAIGTGKTATAEQANEVCEHIRAVIRKKYGARAARSVTIQYGGSMNPGNAEELLAQPDVDGGLIGGASLSAEDFHRIIMAANQ